jgi:sugar-specific transcriptional regulator TrmB
VVVNIESVQKLMSLGFSEYEAKTYISLLSSRSITAYEAAKNAGIPTSKIYEVLDKLGTRGVVQSYDEGGKKKYVPLESRQFIEAQKSRLSSTLEALGEELAGIKAPRDISIIWNIKTYEALIEAARGLVERAGSTLLVSLWAQELDSLGSSLKKAIGRGVKAAFVHFGPVTESIGQIFAHPIEDTIYAEKGGRGFAIVVDGKEALMATVLPQGRAVEGAWSSNRGFVVLAEDYIKHDIYITKIVRRFDSLLIERFGRGYARLRDIFSDTEEPL